MAWKNTTVSGFKDGLAQIIAFATKEFEAGAVTAGTNSGNGILYGASATENSVAETWTVTCTTGGGDGVATFSVSSPSTTGLPDAVCGVPYSIDGVSFIVLAGSDPFVPTTDTFSFPITASTAKWEVLQEHETGADQEYVIMKGVGGGSDEIFIGFRTQSDNLTYFNLEVTGFSGWYDGTPYEDQQGFRSMYSCMRSSPFPLFMVMTGRHIKWISILDSVQDGGYTGWFLPYATESQYAYPQYVGGATTVYNQKLDTVSSSHTNYWTDSATGDTGLVNDGASWFNHETYPINAIQFEKYHESMDGGRGVYPATLINDNQGKVYGSLEGVYCVPNGDSALSSGDIINTRDRAVLMSNDSSRSGTINIAGFDLTGDN